MIKQAISATLVLALCTTTAFTRDVQTRKWGYYGEEGPVFWQNLDESFEICGQGFHQSPILLSDPINATLKPFTTHYANGPAYADDAGYALRVDFQTQTNTLTLDGEVFKLIEFHFHQPSEHILNGKQYPLELHFVHVNDNNDAVALGVFFEEGAENAALKTLLPAFKNSTDANKPVEIQLNPNDLQPALTAFYRYEGSLTTPPCREGLVWLIHDKPMTASKEQLDAFKLQMLQNARPIQKMHSRMLLRSGG